MTKRNNQIYMTDNKTIIPSQQMH